MCMMQLTLSKNKIGQNIYLIVFLQFATNTVEDGKFGQITEIGQGVFFQHFGHNCNIFSKIWASKKEFSIFPVKKSKKFNFFIVIF